jgi:hypothetical protein
MEAKLACKETKSLLGGIEYTSERQCDMYYEDWMAKRLERGEISSA